MDGVNGETSLKARPLSPLFFIPATALLGLGLILPLLGLLYLGISTPDETSFWRDPLTLSIARFTYLQALLSALLSVLLGMVGAVLCSDGVLPGRQWLLRFSLVCFSCPTLLAVLGIIGIYGRSGWLGRWVEGGFYGWPAILIAHVFFNFPLALRALTQGLVLSDRSEELVAISLGASRWVCFYRVTLRKLWPAVQGVFFLIFLYSAYSFLPVLLLGGGPRFTSLETAIYEATKIELNLGRAARLAALQGGVALLCYFLFLGKHKFPPFYSGMKWEASPKLYQSRRPWVNKSIVVGFWGIVSLVAIGPLLTLVVSGMSGMGALFRSLSDNLHAIGASLLLSGLAGSMTVVLAFLLAYGAKHFRSPFGERLSDAAASVPLAVSSLLLSTSWLLWYGSWRGNLVPLLIVQSLVALPPAYRPLRDAWAALPESWYEIAASLGASPWQRLWKLEWPLLRMPLLLSALTAVSLAIGDLGALVIFVPDGIEPMPLRMYRLMNSYRFEEAYALGVILLLLLGAVGFWMGKMEK